RTKDIRAEFCPAGAHNYVAAEQDGVTQTEKSAGAPVANHLGATGLDGGATNRAAGHNELRTTCVDDIVKGGAHHKLKVLISDYIIGGKAPGPNHHRRTRGGGAGDARGTSATKHDLNATALDVRVGCESIMKLKSRGRSFDDLLASGFHIGL